VGDLIRSPVSAWCKVLSAAALAASLAAALPARAGDPFAYKLEVTPEEGQADPAVRGRYTAQFAACQKRARVTYENAACFEAEFTRQDAALNRVWKATFERTPHAMRKPLLAAQRRWIAGRDPFCREDADGFKGGTIVPIVYSDCRVELTIRRTMWLERLR
jgi:uncharacterized protein YecT (DUF1311 family)